VNGRYASLVGREEWAQKSCRDERIGEHAGLEVALHCDLDITRQLFSQVIVLQAEFVPQPEQPPLFYLRNDALIEPLNGRLLLMLCEDYRRAREDGFTHDQNVDQLYASRFFGPRYPHLKQMFGVFRKIAYEEGLAGIWGFGGNYSAVEPGGFPPEMPAEMQLLIERLRVVGDRTVTRKMAERIFGIEVEEGRDSRDLRKLYRRTAKLLHPDRNKDSDAALLCRLLNDAWTFFKG
jgi:hypothetical protein